MRRLRDLLKAAYFQFYRLGLRAGVHILPDHYYTSIPNILELERTQDRWARQSSMAGIAVDLDVQAGSLRECCAPWQAEFAGNRAYREGVERHFGPGYGSLEAQALHGVIRHFKPARIIEVGSGVSTFCMTKALELNRADTGKSARLISIEPFPSAALRALPGIELISRIVQDVPAATFAELQSGDLLFIDSSHTVRAGGDVNYLILEVLPRLQRGVVVHFHDIYFPYDYQRDLLRTFLFAAESTLLQAYLAGNTSVEILFCLSHLHHDRPEELRQVFPDYQRQPDRHGLNDENFDPSKHFPSSIYLRIR